MKALRYITSANMAISDEKLHGPSIDNNLPGMLSMSPFSSRCCQHNHGMGWTYFAEHLVMATADNGIATILYASNEATVKVGKKGQSVRIIQDTHYPFDGLISLTINTEKPVEFPLYLRVPSWANGAEATVNGDNIEFDNAEGKYIRISRKWKDGDKINLNLPMNVSQTVWQENKNSVSVNYGPLILSLKIDEIWSAHDSRGRNFVQDDSHWQEGVDASKWPCYVIKPGTPWNYGLKVDTANFPIDFKVIKKSWPKDDYPFSVESCPIEFSAIGVRIPSWGYDATGMTDVLPDESAERVEETPIKLIPMGAARLRISAFPRCR